MYVKEADRQHQFYQPASATTGNRMSIVVALGNEITRFGLHTMLSALPEVERVTTCENPAKVIDLLESTRFDVLILSSDSEDEIACRMAAEASDRGVKVLLLLDGSDYQCMARAANGTRSSGFLFQDELTISSLANTLSRLSNGEVPMPGRLAHALLSYVHSTKPPQRSRPALLTPREREALSLLAAGLSNRQVARRLSISEHSAKRHVANVLAKLNCPNRTSAVVLALKDGLIEEPVIEP